jgi:hypothetical protein
MTTLKEALEKGELKDFIKEHDKDPKGDLKKVDSAISKMVSQKKSKAPQTSPQDKSEN